MLYEDAKQQEQFDSLMESYKEKTSWELGKDAHGWFVRFPEDFAGLRKRLSRDKRYISVISDNEADKIQEKYEVDVHGEPYFNVPNFYQSGEARLDTFLGRPGDAIQAIRDGQGDVLQMGRSLFGGGSTHSVIRFLNREKGEQLRKFCVEGFADAKFHYVVELNLNYGYGASYLLGEEGEAVSLRWWGHQAPTKFFDREEEAQWTIDALEKRIKEQVESFKTEEEYEEWLQQQLHENDNALTVFIEAVNAEVNLKFRREEGDHREVAHYFEVNQELVKE